MPTLAAAALTTHTQYPTGSSSSGSSDNSSSDPTCFTLSVYTHTLTQGALAPVLASVSLFGIYLVLKYFPDLSLQTFLDLYFFALGTAAITGAARPLLKRLPGPLGQPNMCFDVPDGLLLDEEGKAIEQVGLGF